MNRDDPPSFLSRLDAEIGPTPPVPADRLEWVERAASPPPRRGARARAVMPLRAYVALAVMLSALGLFGVLLLTPHRSMRRPAPADGFAVTEVPTVPRKTLPPGLPAGPDPTVPATSGAPAAGLPEAAGTERHGSGGVAGAHPPPGGAPSTAPTRGGTTAHPTHTPSHARTPPPTRPPTPSRTPTPSPTPTPTPSPTPTPTPTATEPPDALPG